MGYHADEIYQIFQKYCKRIKYVDLKNILKFIFGIFTKQKIIMDGFNSGTVLEKSMEEIASQKNIVSIKDISMPLFIPSVDLHTGAIYVFSSVPVEKRYSNEYIFVDNIEISKAVRASASYPGVFSPCKYRAAELIDGGIRENIPWKIVKQMGADKVISIIFEETTKKQCCSNIIDVVSSSIGILCHELSEYELIGAEYLLRIKTPEISLLDMSQIQNLYQFGYVQTKEKIREIKNIMV